MQLKNVAHAISVEKLIFMIFFQHCTYSLVITHKTYVKGLRLPFGGHGISWLHPKIGPLSPF